jgi:hypothetical protein
MNNVIGEMKVLISEKKLAIYQLIDPGIHLEFLESDITFSKTYKSN